MCLAAIICDTCKAALLQGQNILSQLEDGTRTYSWRQWSHLKPVGTFHGTRLEFSSLCTTFMLWEYLIDIHSDIFHVGCIILLETIDACIWRAARAPMFNRMPRDTIIEAFVGAGKESLQSRSIFLPFFTIVFLKFQCSKLYLSYIGPQQNRSGKLFNFYGSKTRLNN